MEKVSARRMASLEKPTSCIDIGFINANIVGLQYYTNIGTIKHNEKLQLIREPENKRHCNAIEVLNLQGKKLGYIEKLVAEALAPFIDQGSIFVEGFVPKSYPFVYEMPCQIYVSTHRDLVENTLKTLTAAGLSVISDSEQGVLEEKTKEESGTKEDLNLEQNYLLPKQNGSEEEGLNLDQNDVPKEGPMLQQNFGVFKQNGSEEELNLEKSDRLKGVLNLEQSSRFPNQDGLAEELNSEQNDGPKEGLHLQQNDGPKEDLYLETSSGLPEKNGSAEGLDSEQNDWLKEGLHLKQSFELLKHNGSEEGLNLESNIGSKERLDIEQTFGAKEGLLKFKHSSGLPKSGQAMEHSAIILAPLSQYQKETLTWMVQRENSSEFPPFWRISSESGKSQETLYSNVLTNFETIVKPRLLRGGVLAEEMGSDRTLTLITLIATDLPGAELPTFLDLESSAKNPLNSDLENHSPETPNPENSEASVENPFSPSTENPSNPKPKRKRDGGESSGNGTPKRTIVHTNKESVTCTPKELVKNCFDPLDPRGPKTTLVVCPSSAILNWTRQIQEHTKAGSLKVHEYTQWSRKSKELCKFDIVLTTYKTLASELDCWSSPVREMKWLRVILDEAHFLKNAGTKEAKVAIDLKAQKRWAVISTPIENTSVNLFVLMAFLNFQHSSLQCPLAEGRDMSEPCLQALMNPITLGRTKKLNEESVVMGKAVASDEGTDVDCKDGQSLEAKEIEEEKGEEEHEDLEKRPQETVEVSTKIERGAQARAYFGALFGDEEDITFDLNSTTSLHDVVECHSHVDAGKRIQTSEVEDAGSGIVDDNQQSIKVDIEASLKKFAPSYEENEMDRGTKDSNKEDNNNEGNNEGRDNTEGDSLRAMLEAAETSSLSRNQVKKLLHRIVNVALGDNDPWQERTMKLIEEINKIQVEMVNIRNNINPKDEVVKRYSKYIQFEEWSEVLAKAWEEVTRVLDNQSGVLDLQSTNFCDDLVLVPAIHTLRWMTSLLKQRIDVALVYHAYGYDMQCRNEEMAKSLDAVKRELLGVKEELEKTKATLTGVIIAAKEERTQMREKMERDLAELKKENEQMKEEREKMLQASKVLYEENKDLVKKLIGTGILTVSSALHTTAAATTSTTICAENGEGPCRTEERE